MGSGESHFNQFRHLRRAKSQGPCPGETTTFEEPKESAPAEAGGMIEPRSLCLLPQYERHGLGVSDTDIVVGPWPYR